MAEQPGWTIWHRRFVRSAIQSTYSEDAIRTRTVTLRVPRVTPLVLDTQAPAYEEPVQAAMDIRSQTSSPTPEYDTLESGPRHGNYTPYIPAGLEVDVYDEPFEGEFDFFDRGEDVRDNPEAALVGHQIKSFELAPSQNCNFAYYGLLPPHLDSGPTAPFSKAIEEHEYPPCRSCDCCVDDIDHQQGPYRDPNIPQELHGFLRQSLQAHGLKDLFQGGSIPPATVWEALYRIIDGHAALESGPGGIFTSDWDLVENFRAWHCWGHRSIEEWCDCKMPWGEDGPDYSMDDSSEAGLSDDEEELSEDALGETSEQTSEEVRNNVEIDKILAGTPWE